MARPADEGMLRLAEALRRGFIKYHALFGVDVHGTTRQLMAMLAMCPEAAEYVQLYEKKRTEMETV